MLIDTDCIRKDKTEKLLRQEIKIKEIRDRSKGFSLASKTYIKITFISFCVFFVFLFVLFFVCFWCQELLLFYVNFFHLVFVSSKIFNFTDVLFYYAFANRQFRYSTSLHDERKQRVLSSKNVYEIEKDLFPYVV